MVISINPVRLERQVINHINATDSKNIKSHKKTYRPCLKVDKLVCFNILLSRNLATAVAVAAERYIAAGEGSNRGAAVAGLQAG